MPRPAVLQMTGHDPIFIDSTCGATVRRLTLSVIAAASVLFPLTRAADRPGRPPWTTARVVGTPDPPPPFRTERVYPNVRFKHPLLMARAPGTDRLFVGEQDGRLYSIARRPDATAELFFDLRTELKTIG